MSEDSRTRAAFVAHVKKIEAQAIAGDEDATRSLACMALLAEGWRPSGSNDDGGCEIIDLAPYLKLAA